MAIPVSFLSGIRDWKTKYRGAKAPIFIKKIRLSALLFIFCISAVSIRLCIPDVMSRQGIEHWMYLVLLFSMLPVVTLLGHYGGKLSSLPKPPHKSPQKPWVTGCFFYKSYLSYSTNMSSVKPFHKQNLYD